MQEKKTDPHKYFSEPPGDTTAENKHSGMVKKLLQPEVLFYILFGVLTAVENLALFKILSLRFDYRIANLVTLIMVKITAYICNKLFVFHSETESIPALLGEILRFVITRGTTSFLDYFGVIILVEALGCEAFPSKCITASVVVILNYFFGKKYVFKSNTVSVGEKENDAGGSDRIYEETKRHDKK